MVQSEVDRETENEQEHKCLNCGAPLSSPYCPSCGQKDGLHVLTVSEFAHDALNALFSYDSKVWRTLKLLVVRPGQLTVEYTSGRRVPYLGPFQLYFWLNTICFLLFRVVFSERAIPFAQQLALKMVSGRSSNKSGNKTDCVAIALKPLFPSTARGVGEERTGGEGVRPKQSLPLYAFQARRRRPVQLRSPAESQGRTRRLAKMELGILYMHH